MCRRDVAGGSYRMGDVAVTFAGAAASCDQALCKAASPSDSLLAAIFGNCCIQKWAPLPLLLGKAPLQCSKDPHTPQALLDL